MIVAWQFIAWNDAPAKTRPGGYGVMLLPLAHDSPMLLDGPMKYLDVLSQGLTIHTVP
jgi:hypothetical protein